MPLCMSSGKDLATPKGQKVSVKFADRLRKRKQRERERQKRDSAHVVGFVWNPSSRALFRIRKVSLAGESAPVVASEESCSFALW